MKPARRARVFLLLAALAAGVAMAVWSARAAADGDARVLVATVSLWIGGLLLCAGVATEGLARRSTSPARTFELAWRSTWCLSCALVCAGAVAAVPLGARWDERREAATLEWCQRLVARIQSFEDEEGRLPLRLEELGDLQRPRGARELHYRPLAGEFTLWFFAVGAGGSESHPLTSGYNSKRDLWWIDDPDPSGTDSLFYGVGTIDPW
jgi:hypothetical protein